LIKWRVEYKKKAWEDFQELDASQKDQVAKAIRKVKTNPLPQREGGYGVELGNKAGLNLSGCLKIKLKKAGIRVVYQLKREKGRMVIVIIGMRAELEVYREAVKRLGMQ
jgi:mRNA interferase RelE/StbE